MSAPPVIIKPNRAGLASYDRKGRWVKWSFKDVVSGESLHDFFLSLGWRWIEEAGMWFDDEGNLAVAYFDEVKLDYPMERWS